MPIAGSVILASAAMTAPGDMPVYVILAVAASGVAATLAVSWFRGKRSAHQPSHRR